MECQSNISDLTTKLYVYEINDLQKKGVKSYTKNKKTGRKIENQVKYTYNILKQSKKPKLGMSSQMRKSSKKQVEIRPLERQKEVKVS